jgi:DNA-binding MarR family transcriptional regulator
MINIWNNYVNTIEMASISFSPNKMEFLISFTSGDISEDKQKETLNLGQAQILMEISQDKGSLAAIKVLLPTPLGEEAMNAVKKLAEKSEIKTSLDKQ